MLLCGWILSRTGTFTLSIEGKSSILSHNRCSGLQGWPQLYSLKLRKTRIGWRACCFSVVCLARRNSTSLNWLVWLTYVLRQLRRPRLWFQGEIYCHQYSYLLLLHMVCSSWNNYMYIYSIFIYFSAWRVDLKMTTFNSYLMIFRHIEVSNTKLNTIYWPKSSL